MILDLHIHPYCREVTLQPGIEEACRRMFEPVLNKAEYEAVTSHIGALFLERGVEDIIKDMDEAQIDKACIVALDMTTKYNVEMATNEDVGRLAAMHPDRFIPFAGVDPSMGRAAVDKLADAVEKYGCRGLKLVPPLQGFDFSDPKHDPLWRAAIDLGIIVWSHTAHQKPFAGSDARLGHPMLVEPVDVKQPELKIVLGHCGFPWPWEVWSLVVRHKNVYVDISAYPKLYNRFPWDAYFQYDAGGKILFATDYPLVNFKDLLVAFNNIEMPEQAREKILSQNAIDLLGL